MGVRRAIGERQRGGCHIPRQLATGARRRHVRLRPPLGRTVMRCHLLVPDLLWRGVSAPEVYRDLKLPALELTLARGALQFEPPLSVEAWLGRAFGADSTADLPVAALTMALDGGQPGAEYWLRGDPVHLRVNRGELVLADSGAFTISQQEATGLTDTLNRHLQAEGIAFHALHPARWYVRAVPPPQLRTHGLAQVTGKSVERFLPQGSDAARWHRILNECQMLLHSHPVNEQREARGELSVNSVWFWGGGRASQPIGPAPAPNVWADDALARALALASWVNSHALPQTFASWQANADPGTDHLIVIDTWHGAAQYADMLGWREGLLALERDWFSPALAALAAGTLEDLRLTGLDAHHTLELTLRRSALRKFWRRPRALSGYDRPPPGTAAPAV